MSETTRPTELTELNKRLENLQETVTRLQAQLSERSVTVTTATTPGEARPTSRRRLLRQAAIGAAAGMTALGAASMISQTPAAEAAQGVFVGNYPGDSTVSAENTASSNIISANGIYGYTSGTAGKLKGVYGKSDSVDGIGVYGAGTSQASGAAVGVQGTSNSSSGMGVYGIAGGETANGVRGEASGDFAAAVYAKGSLKAAGLVATSVEGQALFANSTNFYGAMLGGGRAAISLFSSGAKPTTRSDKHTIGEIYRDSAGELWYCVADGNPGLWRKMSGPSTSGAMHIIDPIRIVDTRISKGAKKPLSDNSITTILGTDGDAIPSNPTAIFGSIDIINPSNPGGIPYATIYSANLASTPTIANLVYPGGISTSTTFAVSLGTGANTAKFKIFLRRPTDFTIDIQGYYL